MTLERALQLADEVQQPPGVMTSYEEALVTLAAAYPAAGRERVAPRLRPPPNSPVQAMTQKLRRERMARE